MQVGAHKSGQMAGCDRRTGRDGLRIQEMKKLEEMALADAPRARLTAPIGVAEGLVRFDHPLEARREGDMLRRPTARLITPMEVARGQHAHGGSDHTLMRSQGGGGQRGGDPTAVKKLRDQCLGQALVVGLLDREADKRPPDLAALAEVQRMIPQSLDVLVGGLDQACERYERNSGNSLRHNASPLRKIQW